MAEETPKLITEAPLTAEAREALLREQFGGTFPHDGKLLVPDDAFYTLDSPTIQATNMSHRICEWLGINAKHIGLIFEGSSDQTKDTAKYRIFVEQSALKDEFVLGASLAHALVRYLLEDRKHIRLAARDQQDALIATASILLGLGIIVSNGLLPRFTWLEATGIHKHVHHELLGHVQPGQYHQQLHAYLKRYRIPEIHYANSCSSWTSHRLGIKPAKKPSHAVRVAKHQTHITRLKLIGTLWLCFMVIGLSSVVVFHRALPADPQLQAAQDHANFLKKLAQDCHDKVAYDKQYTDITDVLSQQTIDAQEARCTSLDNQYRSAQTTYDSFLVK